MLLFAVNGRYNGFLVGVAGFSKRVHGKRESALRALRVEIDEILSTIQFEFSFAPAEGRRSGLAFVLFGSSVEFSLKIERSLVKRLLAESVRVEESNYYAE